MSIRGSGRTTKQIKAAPKSAIYVVHNHGFKRYCMDIAKQLGRDDIKVIDLDQYELGATRGIKNAVVFDHYVQETKEMICQ